MIKTNTCSNQRLVAREQITTGNILALFNRSLANNHGILSYTIQTVLQGPLLTYAVDILVPILLHYKTCTNLFHTYFTSIQLFP